MGNNTSALEPVIGTIIRLDRKLFRVFDDTLSGFGCRHCALTTTSCIGMDDKYCRGFNESMIRCKARQRIDNKDIILEEVF